VLPRRRGRSGRPLTKTVPSTVRQIRMIGRRVRALGVLIEDIDHEEREIIARVGTAPSAVVNSSPQVAALESTTARDDGDDNNR